MREVALWLIALIALTLSVFDDASERIFANLFGSTDQLDRYEGSISIYQLLANPHKFLGQNVHIYGVFSIGIEDGEGPYELYANQESAKLSVLSNGIQISGLAPNCRVDFSPYEGKYLAIRARVSKELFALVDVNAVYTVPDDETPYSKVC